MKAKKPKVTTANTQQLAQSNVSAVRVIEVNGSAVLAPTLINSYSMLTVPAYWRAMRFLTKNLASFPRCVQLKCVEPPKPHPLDQLLNKPNRLQTGYIFFQTLFFHLVHSYNGYAKIERDAVGNPIGLHNMLPEAVRPFRVLLDGYEPMDPAGWLQFYMNMLTGETLPSDDVIHLMDISHDGMMALNPTDLHLSTMQRATSLDKYQTKFLMNGTVVRGVIVFKDQLSPEQLLEVRTKIRTQYMGPEAEDDLLILDNGGEFQNATLSPKDSELNAQASYSVKDIARITDVPPEFLYEMSDAKYNDNAENAGDFVVRFTFRPIIEMAEAEFTAKLLSPSDQAAGYKLNLNTAALQRGDTAAITTTESQLVGAGIKTRNEARKAMGLPQSKDPDADKLKTSGDTSPVQGKPPAAAAK